jgi:beta-L-arabinofuranosidase (glycosyl hydrolase family 127)
MLLKLEAFLRICYDGAAWRPSCGRTLLRSVAARAGTKSLSFTDQEHLEAAAAWLARAQDATSDGGIAGRYRLRHGWTSSYPETTGYSIPTLLRLADTTRLGEWEDRAARAIRFLLKVQLADGAFPAGEIAENRERPSVFNTGQIISGLAAWHRRTGDDRSATAAIRAGLWMASAQDRDGSWRRWIYGAEPYTYMAYAAGWLGELGQLTDQPRLLEVAERHLDWVLAQVDPETGWFRRCGFPGLGTGADELAYTHTVAYTVAGVLTLSRLLRRQDGLAAARAAAVRAARTLEQCQWLPGLLDRQWNGRASFACLTGNAQMALIWLDLHGLSYDLALISAALKAIDLVRHAQPMTVSDPGVRGGIPGSDPPWGGYLYLAFPNWAAKYFVDALLTKRSMLDTVQQSSAAPAAPAAPAASAAPTDTACTVSAALEPLGNVIAQAHTRQS